MTGALLVIGLLTARAHTAAPALVAPSDNAAAIARAAAAYEGGRLADALTEYAVLATRFPGDARLAYNLGNTYWRIGKRGKAILWYERARRLSPADGDIRFNLRLARSGLADEESAWGEAFDRVLPPKLLWWLAVALLWAICGIIGLALVREWPREKWSVAMTAGIPLFVVLAVWIGLRIHDLDKPWAVVAVPTAEVRSGPGDQFPVGYTAPEGQRALILNRRPGWLEIGIPSKSLKGWVADTSVETI